jgi:hypothetical protein
MSSARFRIRFDDAECAKISPAGQAQSQEVRIADSKFQKGRSVSISIHDKVSGVLTLCGHNPKLSAFVLRT